MDELRIAIAAIWQDAANRNLTELLTTFCAVLEEHPQALEALAGRYRIHAADTGVHFAVSLSANGLERLEETAPVDAALLGKEDAFLRIVRGQLSPALAMLKGDIKVKGKMTQLGKFAPLFH